MAKKEFLFYGKSLEELKKMNMSEFKELIPSRKRRCLNRGLSNQKKDLIAKLKKKNNVKTHLRDMIVFPEMIGKTIRVYKGKEFVAVTIMPEMVGHYLGEFVLTRSKVLHSAPGIGATKSSASISVR